MTKYWTDGSFPLWSDTFFASYLWFLSTSNLYLLTFPSIFFLFLCKSTYQSSYVLITMKKCNYFLLTLARKANHYLNKTKNPSNSIMIYYSSYWEHCAKKKRENFFKFIYLDHNIFLRRPSLTLEIVIKNQTRIWLCTIKFWTQINKSIFKNKQKNSGVAALLNQTNISKQLS